jgi:hypothetical protein
MTGGCGGMNRKMPWELEYHSLAYNRDCIDLIDREVMRKIKKCCGGES